MFLKNKTDQWPMYIKVAILAIITAILWLFNSQFITPLLLGVIVAILTAPVYYFLLKRLNFKKIKFQIPKPLAAILTIAGITLTIGLILNRFVFEVVKEAPDFISQISGFVFGSST